MGNAHFFAFRKNFDVILYRYTNLRDAEVKGNTNIKKFSGVC